MPRAPRSASVSVALLLEALRNAAEKRTLRELAAELEMAWSGVGKLLKGANPRPKTVGKLRSWFLREGWRYVDADADHARGALDVLLTGVPLGPERDRAVAAIVDAVRAARRDTGSPPPGWTESLETDKTDKTDNA